MEAIRSSIILDASLEESLDGACRLLLSRQTEEGYWWFTLEANETIGAGFIQLMHFLGEIDLKIQDGLARRILSQQRPDGSWSIFFDGPSDLSTTAECYFSLRLAGYPPSSDPLERARKFILQCGGLTKVRVFTRIHLALFGLVPWSACPTMPVWFVLLPSWCRVSLYEFSSWARASIVPLLLIDAVRPTHPILFNLEELYLPEETKSDFSFPRSKRLLSLHNLFLVIDRILKLVNRMPWHPGKRLAMSRAEQWVREHIARTEDIYPAMAYAALALKGLGYPNSDPTIQKAFHGLKRFQQGTEITHQQCCISPNWDTPWAGLALIEAGIDPNDESLRKAARYLIQKEIRNFRGDWKFKNPGAAAGGWAFEFENDFFPDVDDTIEILFFLKKVGLPSHETQGPILRGLSWLLSMQSKNGGWAAFDKNNLSQWVNKIPFSDHGACLDPPTPDITGRMLELLPLFGYTREHPVVRQGLAFLKMTQEPFGAWRGRWGVNYIYGTWCVLQGLAAIGENFNSIELQKAVGWLKSIQNKDGGWGESCLSDSRNEYVPLGKSIPSQTAWAVMALTAAGERDSLTVQRGIECLIENQTDEGGWDEPYFTGTGFPGHFYLNYHGYRYYFPVLALGLYLKVTSTVSPPSAFRISS